MNLLKMFRRERNIEKKCDHEFIIEPTYAKGIDKYMGLCVGCEVREEPRIIVYDCVHQYLPAETKYRGKHRVYWGSVLFKKNKGIR